MALMILSADSDIQAVAEFMQQHIPARRLVGVAAGLHSIAPILWGRYESEPVDPLKLSADDPQIPTAATELHLGRL